MKYQATLNYSASVVTPPSMVFAPVAGTRMDQLVPSFGPQYKERGFEGTTAVLQDWIGCARRGEDLIFLHPGGHNGTNFNGDFAYNRQTKSWLMLHLPSDFTDPVWAESVALYGGSGSNRGDNVNISERYEPNGDRVWKDGRPCSTHCWGLVVDAEEFGVFHIRHGIWRYDPVTKEKNKLGPGLFDVPSDSYAFYSRAKKKIYLCGDDSDHGIYGRIWEVDPATGSVAITGLTVQQWYTGDACELEGGGKTYYFSQYWNKSWLVDFDAFTSTQMPAPSFGGDAMVLLMHSNKTGVLALRASGNLSSVDMATGALTDLGPSGIPASLLAVSAVKNGVWGRCKLVGAVGSQSFVFPIETNTDVYEMPI